MPPLLEVSGLTMDFGGIRALDHLDLRVRHGEIVALIGPNGAGKTTFFNCLTGIYTPTGGDLVLTPPGREPRRLNGLKPSRITEQGLARTFQNIRLFKSMTVLENVMIGRHCRTRTGILGAVCRGPRTRREEQEIVGTSLALLSAPASPTRPTRWPPALPYGAQRRLEIARALATEPLLLLLDEPAAGKEPAGDRGADRADHCHPRGRAVDPAHRARHETGDAVSDHIFVMDYGRRIAEGTPAEVRRDLAVIRAYLGEETTDA